MVEGVKRRGMGDFRLCLAWDRNGIFLTFMAFLLEMKYFNIRLAESAT